MQPHTSGLTPERVAETEAVLWNTLHCIHKTAITLYISDMVKSLYIGFSFYINSQSAMMVQPQTIVG